MMIGKPVDQVSAPLLLAELLYEFNREVARLEQQSATPWIAPAFLEAIACRM
jgi:hypothetical protein